MADFRRWRRETRDKKDGDLNREILEKGEHEGESGGRMNYEG